jgi:hypothetical protein
MSFLDDLFGGGVGGGTSIMSGGSLPNYPYGIFSQYFRQMQRQLKNARDARSHERKAQLDSVVAEHKARRKGLQNIVGWLGETGVPGSVRAQATSQVVDVARTAAAAAAPHEAFAGFAGTSRGSTRSRARERQLSESTIGGLIQSFAPSLVGARTELEMEPARFQREWAAKREQYPAWDPSLLLGPGLTAQNLLSQQSLYYPSNLTGATGTLGRGLFEGISGPASEAAGGGWGGMLGGTGGMALGGIFGGPIGGALGGTFGSLLGGIFD